MKLTLTLTTLAVFTLSSVAAPTAIDSREVEKNVVKPIDCPKDGVITCMGEAEYAICDHGRNVFLPIPVGDNRCKEGGTLWGNGN